jgi:hypothetical protein
MLHFADSGDIDQSSTEWIAYILEHGEGWSKLQSHIDAQMDEMSQLMHLFRKMHIYTKSFHESLRYFSERTCELQSAYEMNFDRYRGMFILI